MKLRHWMVALALVGISNAACDWFEDPSPETVSVTIEGPAGDSLWVITSTVFVAARNEVGRTTVNPLAADTTVWELPVTRTFDIQADQRFMLVALPGDTARSLPIQANIQVDDRRPFATSIDVTWVEPLRFLFLFNQEIVSDFELL